MTSLSNSRWRSFLYTASRSRGFLWKFALGALLTGAVVGAVISHFRPPEAYLFGERVLARAGLSVLNDEDHWTPPTETSPELTEAFATELEDRALDFIDVLWAMPQIAPHVAAVDHGQLQNALERRFSPGEARLAFDFLAAWNLQDHAAVERLKSTATLPEPPRYARYALGRIEMKRENYREAYALFAAEGAQESAYESRYMAVRALVKTKDFAALETLRHDPRYERYFTAYVELDLAIEQRDWWKILKTIPQTQFDSYQQDVIVITIIAGLAWALFLFNLGEIKSTFSGAGALCLLGFIAGIVSTTPTIFLVVLQDDIFGFSSKGDIYRIFAYNIGGVGVREEVCKLLLFLPLLPFLLKRDDELEALIVAGFVGLGFAIEENGGYFMLSEAASAPGRFLTANFFHIMLTGLNGLTLFRACKRGMHGVNDFLMVFPLTILAHGAYDALLDVEDVEGGGIAAIIIFIGSAFYFFSRAHALRTNIRMTLSLTGAFVFGVSILCAAVIGFQMATLGMAAGASLIFAEMLGSAVLLFVFFREFNEPLTH